MDQFDVIANQPIVIDNVCHIFVNDIVLGKTDNFLRLVSSSVLKSGVDNFL